MLLLISNCIHDLKDPKLWNYGIFLIMGNAGFIPSTVGWPFKPSEDLESTVPENIAHNKSKQRMGHGHSSSAG